MLELGIGIASLAATVVFSLVGYRFTIGARRERVLVSNKELEEIVIRRVVHDAWRPTLVELSRLVSGKALERHLHLDDLLAPRQILDRVYTRIVESDLIEEGVRAKLTGRISPLALELVSSASAHMDGAETAPGQASSLVDARTTAAMIALLSAFAASLLAFAPLFTTAHHMSLNIHYVVVIGAVFLVNIAVALSLAYLKHQKDTRHLAPAGASALARAMAFEREVLGVISAAGVTVSVSGQARSSYDFVIQQGDAKRIVEIKHWQDHVPARHLSHVVERLETARQRDGAVEALIVTPLAVTVNAVIPRAIPVRLLSLAELESYLKVCE